MKRFRRPARIAGVLLVSCIGLACLGWALLRGSVPQYDGEVPDAAVAHAVDAERDELGSVTLRGADRGDLDWTLGYVHAQERFLQMDLLRRRAAGELAELFGPAALPVDRTARMHRMRARMETALAALAPAQRARVDRYRDGVNAGLAALRVRPFAYLLLRTQPIAWRSEDTLLVIAAMAFNLNDAENKRELAFTRMRAALPESAYRFLAANGGREDAPVAGAPLDWPATPPANDLDLRQAEPPAATDVPRKTAGNAVADDDRLPGSNAFAVDGHLAAGAALVANDMHLELAVPGTWFRVRLVYPDPHGDGDAEITGASLPGTPAVIAGSNGRIAWGFTNSYVDTTDWVRVARDPQDPLRYRTADGWTSISKRVETIRVRGAADERLDVEETRWGPILARDVDGTPLALAWTAQEPGAINVELQRLESARTVDEAVAIAHASGLPPQNLVVGDRAGSIAWTIAGRIPRRAGGYDPALPSDWSQPDTGWQGWLDAEAVPSIANPPWQRLWTANQRIVEGPALALFGDGGYDLGARARQIRDGLRTRARFAPADMLAIQLDDRALLLERWKDLLRLELDRAPASPLRASLRHALEDWHGHASVDSVAYRVVRAWRGEVLDAVLGGFADVVRAKFPDFAMPKLTQSEHVAWQLLDERPPHLLPRGYADWDALLVACADRAAQALDAQPGGLAARRWGERNTLRIAYPLSRALPAFVARWLDMPPDEVPGDSNMPRVQAPDFGASERFAVAPGDERNGYFMMAGGQSGHPLSPYYGSGHADWVRGTPTPFLPGPARHVLRFVPAAGRVR